MEHPNPIKIEVAYAMPNDQVILALEVGATTTVAQAIEQSGILSRYQSIDLKKNKVGIFGKLTSLDKVVQAGDRVEIYRPLIADPKQVRRQRALQGKVTKKGASTSTKS